MKHFTKQEWAEKVRLTPSYVGRWEATPFNLDRVATGELSADYIGRRNMLDYEPNHGTVLLTEGYHFIVDDEEGQKYIERGLDTRGASNCQHCHESRRADEL